MFGSGGDSESVVWPAGGQRGGRAGVVRPSGGLAADPSGLGGALEAGEGGAAAAGAPRLPPLPRPQRRLSAACRIDAAAPSALPPCEMLLTLLSSNGVCHHPGSKPRLRSVLSGFTSGGVGDGRGLAPPGGAFSSAEPAAQSG